MQLNIEKVKYVFTDHAKKRMQERNIDKSILLTLLMNIDKNDMKLGEERIYTFRDLDVIDFSWNNNISFNEMNLFRDLKIVGVIETNLSAETPYSFIVITAYYDDKLSDLKAMDNAVTGHFIKSLPKKFTYFDLIKGKKCI